MSEETTIPTGDLRDAIITAFKSQNWPYGNFKIIEGPVPNGHPDTVLVPNFERKQTWLHRLLRQPGYLVPIGRRAYPRIAEVLIRVTLPLVTSELRRALVHCAVTWAIERVRPGGVRVETIIEIEQPNILTATLDGC